MNKLKSAIEWILSAMFPLQEEKLSGKDNYDDYYLDETEVNISLRRSDERIIGEIGCQK